jgi:DNA primase
MDELDLIKEKINIVDLIQEYLPLKKAGVNFKTNCPFHGEKTASFMVSPERQIWHCFGCGKGGDHFKFLMEKEGMDFKDALEVLAKKAGVVLKRSAPKKDSRDKLYEINLKAQEFFQYILLKHPFGKGALDYLKKRGLTEVTIESFGLGYAPNSWESLTKFLLKKGFTTQEIINCGLGVASQRGCYDRFRGRVTFPLIDNKDRIIGYSGRIIEVGEPKYINTPQTSIFDKSLYLFGINKAKGEIRAKNEAILVEGELDVLMSHQAGIKNIVAVKGSALTQGQVDLLKKYTENLSLCFDTDLAGDGASRKGIDIAEGAGMNVKIIQVKEGKDPAEAVNKDIKIWEQSIAEATPIYDYYLTSVSKRHDPKTPDGIKKIQTELLPIWAKIQSEFVREHYNQKLAALLRLDEITIRKEIDSLRKLQSQNYTQVLHQTTKTTQVMEPRTRRQLLEEYLIAMLLHIPKEHTFVPGFPETLLISESLRQIYVYLVIYLDSISFKGRSFNINEFLKDLPEELSIIVDNLFLTEIDSRLASAKDWQKEVDGVILELKRALIKASLEKLSKEIKNAEQFGKIDTLESLNKRFRDLSVKLKNL